jgi:hypothetical protein
MENKNKFLDKLINKNIPNQNTKAVELWDVEGIIEGVSNQTFKFDLRPLKNNIKGGSFKTKADKIVFDIRDQWIIVDIDELHQYLKENNLKKVELEDLLSKLDWNIILPK